MSSSFPSKRLLLLLSVEPLPALRVSMAQRAGQHGTGCGPSMAQHAAHPLLVNLSQRLAEEGPQRQEDEAGDEGDKHAGDDLQCTGGGGGRGQQQQVLTARQGAPLSAAGGEQGQAQHYASLTMQATRWLALKQSEVPCPPPRSSPPLPLAVHLLAWAMATALATRAPARPWRQLRPPVQQERINETGAQREEAHKGKHRSGTGPCRQIRDWRRRPGTGSTKLGFPQGHKVSPSIQLLLDDRVGH